jgi:hypothetical protein
VLKFESDLVCAPCHHGKMITASDSSVNTMMTERPGQLLQMDTVGPSQVAPWVVSDMFLSLLMTTLDTLGSSFWKARMRCLSTFRA